MGKGEVSNHVNRIGIYPVTRVLVFFLFSCYTLRPMTFWPASSNVNNTTTQDVALEPEQRKRSKGKVGSNVTWCLNSSPEGTSGRYTGGSFGISFGLR